MKSNLVPSAIIAIGISNDCNLGKFWKGDVYADLKESSMHEMSCVRNAVEVAKVLEEKSKHKSLFRMNANGGGDRNPKFEWFQAFMSYLVMRLNIDKLEWVKTAADVSV